MSKDKTSKSTNYSSPVFSFKYFNISNKKYSMKKLNQEVLTSLAQKMCLLHTLTWDKILSDNREAHGTEIITNLKTVKSQYVTSDTNILAFRLTQKARMLGFRQERTFFILWIDPEHTIY